MTPYVTIGPTFQTPAYGWGTGLFGGIVIPSVATTLNGAINNSVTTITVTSATAFPSVGTIDIDTELITYTSKSATQFLGCTRGANGTTAASHLTAATVTNATSWEDWGEESSVTTVSLDPASWSLDNFGQILVATIKNGKQNAFWFRELCN